MILLKVFQKLGYFPAPQQIPGAIITHIRGVMKLPEDLVPDITPRTLYKYHAAIRTHLKINGDGKQIRHIARKAVSDVAMIMDDPADLINVAIETLVAKNCELPAFSTLDILVGRVRKVVHGRVFQTILSRLTQSDQALLERLLDRNTAEYFTEFNRLREAPKSATLTHLDEWVERLTWVLSLGNMERLVDGLPATKITHFAASPALLLWSVRRCDDVLVPQLAPSVPEARSNHPGILLTIDDAVECTMRRICFPPGSRL